MNFCPLSPDYGKRCAAAKRRKNKTPDKYMVCAVFDEPIKELKKCPTLERSIKR